MARHRTKSTASASESKKPEKMGQNVEETGEKPAAHDLLGRKLREYYDDVVKQPVPDRFTDLLNQLEKSTRKKPS